MTAGLESVFRSVRLPAPPPDTGETITSDAPLPSAWMISGADAAVPGPRTVETSAALVTPIRRLGDGGRSTIAAIPTTPDGAGSGGSTSKRVSTRTPGTTSVAMAVLHSRAEGRTMRQE